ncbi:MAG TPA: hypothetical protein VMM84_16860 [Pyrinomonadaceae bacterium]|nr:hypothetical protein [Pyrinomonadaceae bacterium]
MTICPCCGFEFQGTLGEGCPDCGARAVGEPLPRPENELPFYGRSLLLTVAGTLMVLAFVSQIIIAMVQPAELTFGFSSWIAAAETAAWRLKWAAIPTTLIVLWGGLKIYRSMLREPARYCGLRYARRGLMASATVSLLIATFIGITVPERLRQRQDAEEASIHVLGYRYARALLEYRAKFETLPTELKDLARLPDPDGSITALLKVLDSDSVAYKTTADVAALPKKKPLALRGAVIRNAAAADLTDDGLSEGPSFASTNYELRLSGKDGILGTDDDWLVRDGVITKAPPLPRRPSNTTSATETTKQ